VSEYANNKEKWHRAYSKDQWYCSKPPFPRGRDPRRDLFSDTFLDGIMKELNVRDPDLRRELQKDLCEIAEDYLTAALTTPLDLEDSPCDMTLTKRQSWVDTHIVHPAKLLLTALSDENAPLRSEWPDPFTAQEPDRNLLIRELTKLVDRARELSECLAERAQQANHTTEFKFDLVTALEWTFRKHFPGQPVSRGTGASGESTSHFVRFVNMCVREIFPKDKTFSDHIVKEATRKPKLR